MNSIQSDLVKIILATSSFILILAVVSQEAVKQYAGTDRVHLGHDNVAVTTMLLFLGAFQPPGAQQGVVVL